MRLKIAARKSDLARLQAYRVGEALRERHPHLEIEYVFKSSLGDRNLDAPLWTMGSKGVFTQDFLEDLIGGAVDLVVHSWKDLPVEAREHTEIAATLPRADTRDLLLVRQSAWSEIERTAEIRVLSSSPRRAYNLAPFLPRALPTRIDTCRFENVRGNVPTRLRKLLEGEAHALVVAKAAMDRLLTAREPEFAEVQEFLRGALAVCRWMVLPLRANPTAAAQGALAVEIRRDRSDVRALLAAIHCPQTFAAAEAERRILASYGGGCHQKIGVTRTSRSYGVITNLKGLTDAGEVLDRDDLESDREPRWPRTSPDKVFPLTMEEAGRFFAREPMAEAPTLRRIETAEALWVARAEALPETARVSPSAVVWTAGLRSWRKLAARGIWVHGCAEGLGEREFENIEALHGLSVRWLKLTHEGGAPAAEDGERLATYRLVAAPNPPDLRGKTHFFWTSASGFFRALELYPEIKSGYHSCGPGHSYDLISQALGGAAQVEVFLSQRDWLKAVLKA